MTLYAFFAMITSAHSPDPILSFWKGYEVLVHISVAAMVAQFLKSKEDIQDILNIIYVVLGFLVISALVGAVGAPSEALLKAAGGPMSWYLKGLYPPINSNTLSQLSGILSATTLCTILMANMPSRKLGLVVVFILAFLCLLLAHSRTSLFAFMCSVILLLIYSRSKMLAVVGVAACMVLTVSDAVIGLIQQYILRGQTAELFISMSNRLNIWPHFFEKVWESPLIGHGFYAGARMRWGVATVDNTYLDVLLGAGVVGLCLFCLAILAVPTTLLGSGRIRLGGRLDNQWRVVWCQLVPIFIFLFMRSLTGPSFHLHHINLTLFVLLAVCASGMRRLMISEDVETIRVERSV